MVFIIGITGGSASGKSSFAKELKRYYQEKGFIIEIIHMDNFYKGISDFTEDELKRFNNNNLNLDSPSMINIDSITEIITNPEKTYEIPIYHRDSYDTIGHRQINLKDNDIVIVEGIFIFNNNNFDIYDMTIYIDTPIPVRLMRRLDRYPKDLRKKQMEYYNKFVVSSFMKYIMPYRYKCKYVIDGDMNFEDNIINIKKQIDNLY